MANLLCPILCKLRCWRPKVEEPPPYEEGWPAFPTMTANNAPAPYLVTGNFTPWTGQQWWNGFQWVDHYTASHPAGSPPWWCQMDLGVEKTICAAGITSSNGTVGSSFVITTAIAASNDGTNFVELHRQSWGGGMRTEVIRFDQPFPKYRYWRFHAAAGNGWGNVGSFRLWMPTPG